MKSRRSTGLPFALSHSWTPEQALAVFDLLGELRGPIWSHYQKQLVDLILRDRHHDIDRHDDNSNANPSMYCDCAIPTNWTSEQAFAVVELLDSLNEHIWFIYHPDLHDLIRKHNRSAKIVDLKPDDIPF